MTLAADDILFTVYLHGLTIFIFEKFRSLDLATNDERDSPNRRNNNQEKAKAFYCLSLSEKYKWRLPAKENSFL
jgi:hypothetical protein